MRIDKRGVLIGLYRYVKINKSIYPHRTVEEFVDQQMAY